MKNIHIIAVKLGICLTFIGQSIVGNPTNNLEGWVENNTDTYVTVTGIGKYVISPFQLAPGRAGMFNFLWWWDFSYNPSPTSGTDWKRGALVQFANNKYSPFEVWFEGFRANNFRHIRAWVGGNPKVIERRGDVKTIDEEVLLEREGLRISLRWVPYSWAIADVKFVIYKL